MSISEAKLIFNCMIHEFSCDTIDKMVWEADLNQDGKMSIEELVKLFLNSIKKMFRQHDKDGDGFISNTDYFPDQPESGSKVSFEEFVDRILSRFLQERFEVEFTEEQVEKILKFFLKKTKGKPMHTSAVKLFFKRKIDEVVDFFKGKIDGPGHVAVDKMIEETEPDTDGKMSTSQLTQIFQDLIEQFFTEHDKNHDGFISSKELFPDDTEYGSKFTFEVIADKIISVLFEKYVELKFTEDQFEKVWIYFEKSTRGKSMPIEAVKELFKGKIQGLSDETVENTVAEADFDGDGKMSTNELTELFQDLIKKIFRTHDKDGDGFISSKDYFPDLPESGSKVSFEQVVDQILNRFLKK